MIYANWYLGMVICLSTIRITLQHLIGRYGEDKLKKAVAFELYYTVSYLGVIVLINILIPVCITQEERAAYECYMRLAQ